MLKTVLIIAETLAGVRFVDGCETLNLKKKRWRKRQKRWRVHKLFRCFPSPFYNTSVRLWLYQGFPVSLKPTTFFANPSPFHKHSPTLAGVGLTALSTWFSTEKWEKKVVGSVTGSQTFGVLTCLGVIFMNFYVHCSAIFAWFDVILLISIGANQKILANLTDFEHWNWQNCDLGCRFLMKIVRFRLKISCF